MSALFKDRRDKPARHVDPDAAITQYLEQLRKADVAGSGAPAAVLNGLGDAYLDKGDPRSAVDYYRQAAETYAAEGMLGNAIALCRKIRRYAPEDPQAGLLLGRYYAAKGMRADARAELEAFIEQRRAEGRRRETIEALRELVRLEPDDGARQEELAQLCLEDGQREAAVGAYHAALRAFQTIGEARSAERVRAAMAEIEGPNGPEPAAARAPAGRTLPLADPLAPVTPPVDSPGRRLDPVAPDPGPAGPRAVPESVPAGGLELEPTSYEDDSALTAAGLEGEPFGLAPAEPPAAAEAPGPDAMIAAAERHARAGRMAEAGRTLARAAESYRTGRRWGEAVDAYRRLSELGQATAEEFAAWSECARQKGEAADLLGSLSAACRWYLDAGNRDGARRSAEEMLLIDPRNEQAIEILVQAGGPRLSAD